MFLQNYYDAKVDVLPVSDITRITDENVFISVLAGLYCLYKTANRKKGKLIYAFHYLYIIENMYFCNLDQTK